MAEAAAPGSLGDFFAKKKKKNIKGSNLNNEAAKPAAEEKKPKSAKDKEEEGWEEEQVAAPTMKVEVAGKLTREDEKKDEEDTVAPAWNSRKQSDARNDLSDKKYPTLAKAVGQSSNINIDDGSEGKINIKTTKNVFASLANEDDDEDAGPRRPKEIKPAMVQKQKGERESAAIQREVDKYGGPKKGGADDKKKKAGKKKKEESDEDDDDEDDEEEAPQVDKRKKKDKKAGEKADETEKPQVELEEDVKIQPDLEASREKYKGRTKLPTKELPASELEEEKENRPAPQVSSKKKKKFMEEEEKPKKLLVADWD